MRTRTVYINSCTVFYLSSSIKWIQYQVTLLLASLYVLAPAACFQQTNH